VVPVVGAWDADDYYYGCGTGETLARLRVLSLLDVDSVAPLMQWSLVCQLPVSRSVKSCCVTPVQGKGVTVEDGTDIPAEPPAFNTAGHSGPVDQGLPSATSSLRVKARTRSSYSRSHLHVKWGSSLLGFGHVDRVRHGA
jgi:hypothetical protein